MSETNSMAIEPVTMLNICILIDGKDILLDVILEMKILQKGF